jgi:hypothetical protein
MSIEPDPRLAETVRILKEAFESGRTVTLQTSDREAPLCGCVSHIHEGAAVGEYVFSAFVGEERIVIGDSGASMPNH